MQSGTSGRLARFSFLLKDTKKTEYVSMAKYQSRAPFDCVVKSKPK